MKKGWGKGSKMMILILIIQAVDDRQDGEIDTISDGLISVTNLMKEKWQNLTFINNI